MMVVNYTSEHLNQWGTHPGSMEKLSYLLNYAVYLVQYLYLWARKCRIVISIVIVNAIVAVQRRIDRSRHRRFSLKKVFLQISQNSQENNCARVSSLQELLLKPGPAPWKTWNKKNLNLVKPGSWKIWTLKNLDPKKHRKQLDIEKWLGDHIM